MWLGSMSHGILVKIMYNFILLFIGGRMAFIMKKCDLVGSPQDKCKGKRQKENIVVSAPLDCLQFLP